MQESVEGMDFAVRTSVDPLTLVPQITEAVRQVDKDLPLFEIKTQEREIEETQVEVVAFANACGFFGGLALVLASIGLYGIMSYTVTRRTNEIGIRMALGASGKNVVGMMMRESLMLVGIGIAIGLLAALGVARLITFMLYGLAPHDPATIGVAVVLMLMVAGFAAYLPARRASRVDPMVALRYE
jgi:ABC-type antimicrobial peptide transport system permease subunit